MTPEKRFEIVLFGKTGCDKCKTLGKRLDTLLADVRWKDFSKSYCDIETEEGIVRFCSADCLNPQRIPSFLVTRWDEAIGRYEPVPNPRPGAGLASGRLYAWLGIQTDYSEDGKGVITPRMITQVLEEALVAR